MAVAAAVATILQIHQIEQRKLRRQINAARATMPLVLSAICNWATEVTDRLKGLHPAPADLENEPGAPRVFVDKPNGAQLFSTSELVPTLHVAELKAVIEATDDETVINRIAETLGGIQVLATRLSAVRGREPIMRSEIDEHVIEAATIYAQASSMFDFARRKADTVGPAVTWQDVRKALLLWQCLGARYDSLRATVQRLEDAGTPPGHR